MIRAGKAHLSVAAATHAGMRGKTNEDRYSVSAYTSAGSGTPALLAIVSDGIGGHRAGEVAAEIAVEAISRKIAAQEPDDPVNALRAALHEASQAVLSQAESDQDRKGMGATAACCWIIGDQLYTVTVGDSRIYLLRDGRIQQLSVDHTWIQDAIDQGLLTAGQGKNHPNAHVIRRYLGSKQPLLPDTRLRLQAGESDEQAEANQGTRLLPGDRLLLCSDGLTDLVEDEEINSHLAQGAPEPALRALIDLANSRGGHDNITLVCLEMPPVTAKTTAGEAPRREAGQRRRWLWIALVLAGLLIALCILAAVLVGMYIYAQREPPDTRGWLFWSAWLGLL